ncbi:MAG: DUF6677 family protein [Pyrinomonadaceae bacterium]
MSADNPGRQSLPGAFAVGLLGWAVPGVGYLLKGRIVRAVIVGGAVFAMLFIGLSMGGHLFNSQQSADIGLLAYVYGFCDLGAGLTYFFCLWKGIGVVEQAQRATAEYGNIFLMIAGLLNFLAALDSFDIAVGRKS